MRNKRDCMNCGTGLCPRNETWAKHDEPCDDCGDFLPKEHTAPEQRRIDAALEADDEA